jgi:hypothetical protein
MCCDPNQCIWHTQQQAYGIPAPMFLKGLPVWWFVGVHLFTLLKRPQPQTHSTNLSPAWVGVGVCRQRPLEDLLELLVSESDPRLPPWFTCIDTLAQHLTTTPSRYGLCSVARLTWT